MEEVPLRMMSLGFLALFPIFKNKALKTEISLGLNGACGLVPILLAYLIGLFFFLDFPFIRIFFSALDSSPKRNL